MGRLPAQFQSIVHEVGELTKAVAKMIPEIHRMGGCVMEVMKEVTVERGRVGSPRGFVLPRLGK